jgi:hypothetical protein
MPRVIKNIDQMPANARYPIKTKITPNISFITPPNVVKNDMNPNLKRLCKNAVFKVLR